MIEIKSNPTYHAIPTTPTVDDFEANPKPGQSVFSSRAKSMGIVFLAISVVIFGVVYSNSRIERLGSAPAGICELPTYSKTTLKLAHEETFMGLIKNTKKQYKFEASDVVFVHNDFYTICDSSWSIDKIGESMTPFSPDNVQIGSPNREKDESGYEAIFYDYIKSIFYVVRESIVIDPTEKDKAHKSQFHALVEEVRIDQDGKDYQVERICVTEYEFDGDSKGFEGAVGLRDASGELYMLGLCEGNHCKEGDEGKEHGHGRAVLMRKVLDVPHDAFGDYSCVWKTERILKIPAEANFQDYSALSISSTGRVAITSQEESQVWLGRLSHWTPAPDAEDDDDSVAVIRTRTAGGYFDPQRSEFLTGAQATEEDEKRDDKSNSKSKSLSESLSESDVNSGARVYGVFDFPRGSNCEVLYCNIEGVHWINDELLVTVSDQMKKGGKQDFRCLDKDQSIQVFSIPQ